MKPFEATGHRAQKSGFRCCVAGCKTKASNGFHNFPTNLETRLKWLKNTNNLHLNHATVAKSYHKVCKKHFSENDFVFNAGGKLRLKKGSVPSLFLPEPVIQSQDDFQPEGEQDYDVCRLPLCTRIAHS